tara:strand:+ start:281 stop:1210 length:930 start_codon:yes stop_codon:yes gene_type:complete
VCDPVTIGTFAISSASSIYQHNQKKRQIREANKAKLANWNETKKQYFNEITLKNTKWKNQVQDTEIAIDNLFAAQAKQWETQDLALQEAIDAHAFNKVELIKQMYEAEYAGEQTGVTAQRKARSSIRDAGMALTKSVRGAIIAQDKTNLSKEVGLLDVENKRRAAWMKTRQSPIPGMPPPPPELNNIPGNHGLALKLALSAVSSTVTGLQAAKAAKEAKEMKELILQNITNQGKNKATNIGFGYVAGDYLKKMSADQNMYKYTDRANQNQLLSYFSANPRDALYPDMNQPLGFLNQNYQSTVNWGDYVS